MAQIDNINKLLFHLQIAFATEPKRKLLDDAVLPHKSTSKWSCYNDYCIFDAFCRINPTNS